MYFLTPTRIDGLVLGALVALAAQSAVWSGHIREWAGTIALAAVGGVVVIVAVEHSFNRADDLVQAFGLTLVTIAFVGLVVGALYRPPQSVLRKTMEHSLLRTFGKYSYGLYLLHFIAMGILLELVREDYRLPVVAGSALPAFLAYTVVISGASLFLAWISWHIIESPALSLKRFFPYGEHARPQQPKQAPSAIGGETRTPSV